MKRDNAPPAQYALPVAGRAGLRIPIYILAVLSLSSVASVFSMMRFQSESSTLTYIPAAFTAIAASVLLFTQQKSRGAVFASGLFQAAYLLLLFGMSDFDNKSGLAARVFLVSATLSAVVTVCYLYQGDSRRYTPKLRGVMAGLSLVAALLPLALLVAVAVLFSRAAAGDPMAFETLASRVRLNPYIGEAGFVLRNLVILCAGPLLLSAAQFLSVCSTQVVTYGRDDGRFQKTRVHLVCAVGLLAFCFLLGIVSDPGATVIFFGALLGVCLFSWLFNLLAPLLAAGGMILPIVLLTAAGFFLLGPLGAIIGAAIGVVLALKK